MRAGRYTPPVRAVPLLIVLSSLLAAPAHARDLRGRIGLGFQNQFSSLTSLSIKLVAPAQTETVNVAFQVLGGFAFARSEEERAFVGGRVLLPLLAEDNLNLFASIGGGWLRTSDARSWLRVQVGIGAEVFLFGLENLGISGEVGLRLDATEDDLIFATASDGGGADGTAGPSGGTSAGIAVHYYFGGPKSSR